MRENVEADREETDFLRMALAFMPEVEAEPEPVAERRVERKHSSHWAKTRGVIVSRSSIAERIVNCSWTVRMGDCSVVGC
jgi:hypothetical protein